MTKLTSIDNLPVQDARKPMVLTITKADCKNGDPKHPNSCAVARSLQREFRAKEVRVHLARVYIKTSPDKWTRYIVPKSLRSEIIAFDRGGEFAPGEYYLSAARPSVQLGAKRKVPKRKTGTHPQRARSNKKYHIVTDVRNGPA
jgi:hypothetical protein